MHRQTPRPPVTCCDARRADVFLLRSEVAGHRAQSAECWAPLVPHSLACQARSNKPLAAREGFLPKRGLRLKNLEPCESRSTLSRLQGDGSSSFFVCVLATRHVAKAEWRSPGITTPVNIAHASSHDWLARLASGAGLSRDCQLAIYHAPLSHMIVLLI